MHDHIISGFIVWMSTYVSHPSLWKGGIVFPPASVYMYISLSVCLSQNHVGSPTKYLHEKPYKHKHELRLDDVQSIRTITFAFKLFELLPFETLSITNLKIVYN